MTTDLLALLDRLDAAHTGATEGPWYFDRDALAANNETGDFLFDHRDVVLVEDHPEGVASCIADGELIVAAVNALPQLTSAVRAALALADRWERGATRWADPLPIPPEVEQLRAALRTALASALPDTTKD